MAQPLPLPTSAPVAGTLPRPMDPVVVLWDMENCPPPSRLDGTTIAQRLCDELITFGVCQIFAFANVGTIRPEMRDALQTFGVIMVDAYSSPKRKELVDKMIFTHMMSFALDHRPPATIVLISGDIDYALPLACLRQRHYKIVLVRPDVNVNRKLLAVANHVLSFTNVVFPDAMFPTVASASSSSNTGVSSPGPAFRTSTAADMAAPTISPSLLLPKDPPRPLGSTPVPHVAGSAAGSESDSLSQEAEALHVADLALVMYEEAIKRDPPRQVLLLSSVGNLLQLKFKDLFQKGVPAQLARAAAEHGLLAVSYDSKGHPQLEFNCSTLEKYLAEHQILDVSS